MNELIKVDYSGDRPMVLARDLHEFLEVKTVYGDWFPRMCEYGFSEGIDFFSFLRKSSGGASQTGGSTYHRDGKGNLYAAAE